MPLLMLQFFMRLSSLENVRQDPEASSRTRCKSKGMPFVVGHEVGSCMGWRAAAL